MTPYAAADHLDDARRWMAAGSSDRDELAGAGVAAD
jgi:hypothetical protein